MPTPTTITYSLSLDAPGGAINGDKLATAIRASAISVALGPISVIPADDVFSVGFKDVPSDADRAVLDGDAGAGGTDDAPSDVHPAGGLIASTDNTANMAATQKVEVTNQPRTRDDGTLYAVPKPSGFGLVMCDRDMRVNTCIMDPDASLEDWKMNTQTNKEVDWGELELVGVYKNVAGVMTVCADQADADVNGVLSVWDYAAKAGGNPVLYEIRDGLLYVDPSIPSNEEWLHRAYAVVAPAIPAAYGGSIAVFDGYLAANPDNVIAALSPQATVLDPAGQAGAPGAVLRLYIVHPAGSKKSHVLRLVTYRAPGTF